MAKYICIGVEHKAGTFQDMPYDNMVLQCLKSNPDGFGMLVEPIKIKTQLVDEVMGHPMTATDWKNLVGSNLTVYFGKFNKVDTVIVNDPAESIADMFMRVQRWKPQLHPVLRK